MPVSFNNRTFFQVKYKSNLEGHTAPYFIYIYDERVIRDAPRFTVKVLINSKDCFIFIKR